jgi:hypothetical protein
MLSDNIIDVIVRAMEFFEGVLDYDGLQKKEKVLQKVKQEVGEDVYERYFYMITLFIDFMCEYYQRSQDTH